MSMQSIPTQRYRRLIARRHRPFGRLARTIVRIAASLAIAATNGHRGFIA